MKTKKMWVNRIAAVFLSVALIIPGFYLLPSPPVNAAETLSIDTGPAVLVGGTTNQYKFPELVVNAPDGVAVQSVTVQFTSAIQSNDAISVTAASGFTILSGSKAGNVSINASGKTSEEWAEYLRTNLTISLSTSNALRKLRFNASAAAADAIYDYNAENGHYYLAVNSKVYWTAARDAAAATEYLGMQGYLATVTSKSEQDFLTSLIKMNTWLGGTCEPSYLTGLTLTEGPGGPSTAAVYNSSQAKYFWATGPEAGQAYWFGSFTTAGTSYMYTNWASAEPNNASGEWCTHMWGESQTIGTWNDYNNTNACAYIIEYGGMPGDKPITDIVSEGSSVIEINLDPTGKTLSTNVQADSITVGEELVISDRVNGTPIQEILDRDYPDEHLKVEYTYYKKEADGSWTELDGAPVHPGEYKVTSTLENFNGDEDTFTISPKQLTVSGSYSKVYDGKTEFASDVSLSGIIDNFTDVRFAYDSGEWNSKNVAEADTVTLSGVRLEGENAIDYTLKDLNEDGTFLLPAAITPKPLRVSPSFEVNESWAMVALPYEYKHNIVEYSETADVPDAKAKAVPDNMLAFGDKIDETLGTPVFTCLAGDTELDRTAPLAGDYALSVSFPEMSENAKHNYSITYDTFGVKIKKRQAPSVEIPGSDPDDPNGPKVISSREDPDGTVHVVIGDSISKAPGKDTVSKSDLLDLIKGRYSVKSALENDVPSYSEVSITKEEASLNEIYLGDSENSYVVSAVITDGLGNTTTILLNYSVGAWPSVNVDTDGDGEPDVNIDKDGDGIPDINIVDKDKDGVPDEKIDTREDVTPDVNVDIDGDGKPDINVDTDGDGKPDVNVDTDGDGKPDVNIVDKDGDGEPDKNIDNTDPENPVKPDVNVDTDGDGEPDINIDTDDDGKPDVNIVDKDKDGKPDKDIDNTDPENPVKPDVNVDTDGDGEPDVNIDTDGDGFPDTNIVDKDGDGKPDGDIDNTDPENPVKPDVNVDTDGDGKPDVNIDTNDDGKPDVNIVDKDGDGEPDGDIDNSDPENPVKPDVNVDTDGDGKPDVNVDTDDDGKPDVNVVDKDGDGKPDTDIDPENPPKPDVNVDTDGDGKPDVNIDNDNDGNPDVNVVDKDGDGKPDKDIDNTDPENPVKPDVNIDSDKDGKPDVNIDNDNDGKPDVNIDTTGNGEPDLNIDADGDGKPDVNVDTDNDGKPNINIDTTGNGVADTNIDTDGDGIADINVDTTGDGKADSNLDTDGDGVADTNIIGGNDHTADYDNAFIIIVMTVSLLGISLAVFAKRRSEKE